VVLQDTPYQRLEGDDLDKSASRQIKRVEDESFCVLLFKNPTMALIFFFNISSLIWGIVAFIVFFTSEKGLLHLPNSLTLIAVAFLAAYEAAHRGTFTFQISNLSEAATSKESNKESSCNILRQEKDRKTRLSMQLEKGGRDHRKYSIMKSKLRGNHAKLTKRKTELANENQELHDTIFNLKKERIHLEKQSTDLSRTVEEIRKNMKGLGRTSENLGKMVEYQKVKSRESIKNLDDNNEAMDELVKQQGQVQILQKAESLFQYDKKEGITESVFKRFSVTIPSRYRDVIKKDNLTFGQVKDMDTLISPRATVKFVWDVMQKADTKDLESERLAQLSKTELSSDLDDNFTPSSNREKERLEQISKVELTQNS